LASGHKVWIFMLLADVMILLLKKGKDCIEGHCGFNLAAFLHIYQLEGLKNVQIGLHNQWYLFKKPIIFSITVFPVLSKRI
jgi:hypothetical protein